MEKDEHHNFKHGMWEQTGNFSHKERLLIWSSAEDYIEQLGGEDELMESEKYDCYLLALTEFRLARAEGIVFENVSEYLDKQTPEKNLDTLVKRRQNLRKDLGLLRDSPEQKQAESAGDFFNALSGNNDE